jgi:type III secretion protein J
MRVPMPLRLRAIVVVALLGALHACTSVVRSGLSEREADALLLALDDRALAATKERMPGAKGYEVHVASAELSTALRVLHERGGWQAPQPTFAELYGEPSLVPTPAEERERHAHATAGELARSIEALPGVVQARVHLTAPQPRAALDAPASTWRASVVVQRRAGAATIDEATLRALIAGAVAPLPEANIAIAQAELAPTRAAEWARIGPFTVGKRDAPRLRIALFGLLALNALLAVLLVTVVARKRARVAGRAQTAASSEPT